MSLCEAATASRCACRFFRVGGVCRPPLLWLSSSPASPVETDARPLPCVFASLPRYAPARRFGLPCAPLPWGRYYFESPAPVLLSMVASRRRDMGIYLKHCRSGLRSPLQAPPPWQAACIPPVLPEAPLPCGHPRCYRSVRLPLQDTSYNP